MQIPVDSVALINRQRKGMDTLKVAELAEAIRSSGLLHPIVVRKPFPHEDTGGKPLVLVVGGRRLAAHIFLKRATIEANLKENLSPLDAEVAELEENLKRVDLTPFEQVEARARIHALRQSQDPFHTAAKTAEELGITPMQMSRDLKLAAAMVKDPGLKKLKKKGAALRHIDHKQHVADRTAAAIKGGVNIQDLRDKIVCADASTWIRTIPTASVDLVFTDPPWGIDADKVIRDAEGSKGLYDDDNEKAWDLITDLVPHWVRILRETGWLVSFISDEGYERLRDLIRSVCLEHFDYRQNCRCEDTGSLRPESPRWIWVRENSTNMGHWPELHAANRYECLLVANRGKAKLVKKPVTNVLRYDAVYTQKDRAHFMQKPDALCREVIERCTVQGETVLDSTCGSGVALIAAAALNRDFRGCDNNPDVVGSAISYVAPLYKPEAVRWAIERGRKGAQETARELAAGPSAS